MTGAHPVHVAFAKSINADIYKLKHRAKKDESILKKILNIALSLSEIPRGYDIYLTESCFYYPAILKAAGLLKGSIVNLNSSPLLYWMKTNRIKGIEKGTLLYLLGKVDGHIFLGKKWQQEFQTLAPSVVGYPFISNKDVKLLKNVRPDLNGRNICIVASMDYYYKGIDILVSAFEKVHEAYPDSKLYIVGQIEVPEKYKNREGIIFTGRVDDLGKVFSKCSLYVHPARGEVFAVSVLEAMCAGLPAIVSCETGNSEIVDREFVSSLDPNDVAKKIIKYFELSAKERQTLSNRAKKTALRFTKKIMLARFKRAYNDLLCKI